MATKRKGEAYIFITGISLTCIILIAALLLWVISSNGLALFWPERLSQFQLRSGETVLGEVRQVEELTESGERRYQLKIGNRELYGLDFRWIAGSEIVERSRPNAAVTLERLEYGNFYGFFKPAPGETHVAALADYREKRSRVDRRQERFDAVSERLQNAAKLLGVTRNQILALRYEGATETDPGLVSALRALAEQEKKFAAVEADQRTANQALHEPKVLFTDIRGQEVEMDVASITRLYFPNELSVPEKMSIYLSRVAELLTDDPREANTEGGIFPAIFGTVMMILLMSVFSFPLGVIAAIYLREYAKPGALVKCARIAVSNLAGVPSIIYGIFGLGFLIYGVGSGIDSLFYPERLPTPTFGTGGILWASITLALLTVPVVIVATEEALSTIPPGMREASIALGATRFQTLTKIVIPLATPGMMTGFILAMARAAGEVAPLMITGVVKLAPALPIDGIAPFFHLERKFMHLGFHIFDVGFQSPNVEAAKPMVYATTFLLVIIVLCMSMLAIVMRERIKRKFSSKAF